MRRRAVEQALLLALLDEGGSVVSRVLVGIDVDVNQLRQTVATWSEELSPQPRRCPSWGRSSWGQHLRVLQLMFREYGQVQVVREADRRLQRCGVLLVQPSGGRTQECAGSGEAGRPLPICTSAGAMPCVKSTLPSTTARLVDSPIVPDGPPSAG